MRRMLQLATGMVFMVGLAACSAQMNMEEQLLKQGCSVNTPDPRACDPADTKKTTVCHIPPGNPANAHTICIGNAAVQHHIDNHGDFIGTCSCTTGGGDGGTTDDAGGGGGSGSDGGTVGMDGGIVL